MIPVEHFTQTFADESAAHSACRKILSKQRPARQLKGRPGKRLRTSAKFCTLCTGWHIVPVNTPFTVTDIHVLQKLALGLLMREIGDDLGESEERIKRRVRNLREHYDALSTAHLVALGIFFGLVDVSTIGRLYGSFFTGIDDKEPHG